MIKVHLYETLKSFVSNSQGAILMERGEEGRVIDVIRQLGINPADVHLIIVNGAGGKLDTLLCDGDRLSLF